MGEPHYPGRESYSETSETRNLEPPINKLKLEGTANGPMENAAEEARQRGTPGANPAMGGGAVSGPRRWGEQRSHLREQGGT